MNYEDYSSQFEYCPLCGYKWGDPRGCKIRNMEDEMPDLHDLMHKYPKEPHVETWWECYVEGTNEGTHHHHRTLQDAKKEAERLARLEGKRVCVFEFVGRCKTKQTPVEWEIPMLW